MWPNGSIIKDIIIQTVAPIDEGQHLTPSTDKHTVWAIWLTQKEVEREEAYQRTQQIE